MNRVCCGHNAALFVHADFQVWSTADGRTVPRTGRRVKEKEEGKDKTRKEKKREIELDEHEATVM